MFVLVLAHEPVEQLCLFIVRPMSGPTGPTILTDLGIVRVIIVDIGSSLLRGTLSILGFELFTLGRGRRRLTIDGLLYGHLMGCGVK